MFNSQEETNKSDDEKEDTNKIQHVRLGEGQ